MRPPCRALIAGDHLNADAITAAIISSEQGTPTRLLFYRHLFDCCVSSAVAHRAPSSIAAVSHHDAIPPLPLPPLPCIDRVHRAATHLPLSYRVAVPCPITSPSSIANASPPSISRQLRPQQATIKMLQWPSLTSSKRAPPRMS